MTGPLRALRAEHRSVLAHQCRWERPATLPEVSHQNTYLWLNKTGVARIHGKDVKTAKLGFRLRSQVPNRRVRSDVTRDDLNLDIGIDLLAIDRRMLKSSNSSRSQDKAAGTSTGVRVRNPRNNPARRSDDADDEGAGQLDFRRIDVR